MDKKVFAHFSVRVIRQVVFFKGSVLLRSIFGQAQCVWYKFTSMTIRTNVWDLISIVFGLLNIRVNDHQLHIRAGRNTGPPSVV